MLIPKSNEITKRREEKGMSKGAVARKAGLPGNALGRIEKHYCNSTHPIRAKAIAKALGCRVEDIFERV